MAERDKNFIVLAPLEPMEVGQNFEKIPAHMTVIGWFALNELYREGELRPLLAEVFENASLFQAGEGAEKEYFGTPEQIAAKEIPVTKLSGIEGEPWEKLHEYIVQNGTLFPIGSPFNDIFSPHISDTSEYSLPVGDSIQFSQVAVISKDSTAEVRVRTVEDIFTLRGVEPQNG